MTPVTSMFLQLFAVATTIGWTAGEAVHLTPSPEHPKAVPGFFAEMALGEAVWEAFAEGVLVLIVFAGVSLLMRKYRKRAAKTLKPSKDKSVSHHSVPLGPRVANAERGQAHKATSRAKAPGSASAGLTTQESSKLSGTHAVVNEANALASAVKAGTASKLPELLDVALKRSLAAVRPGTHVPEEEVASQLLLAALRACAGIRCFNEAISAYDHIAAQVGQGNAHLWSVLLYCVVEAGAFNRCKSVFENLSRQASPSGHDFVNMVRCFAGLNDEAGFRETLSTLRGLGHVTDTYTWNRALAACSGSDSVLDLAEVLASADLCGEGLDSVGYNTLMKYNARAGRITRCFQLRTEMVANGIEASEVTFGILLDACVASKQLDRAREVFDDLCSSGLRLNVVHCTTFIKVLASAGRLDEAAGVLREMGRLASVKPDLIAYATLVKGYAESGDVSAAMDILELMLKERVRPDEILFNSVLTACCTFPMKAIQVMRTFETLIGHGMKPTSTTLSILLKGLAHTEAISESLLVLKDAPKQFGLEPETRLFAQLAQTCVKARKMEALLQVFDGMLETTRRRGERLDAAIAGRFIRSCLLGGELAVAVELREKIRDAGVTLEAQVEKMLSSSLSKRTLAPAAQSPPTSAAAWKKQAASVTQTAPSSGAPWRRSSGIK